MRPLTTCARSILPTQIREITSLAKPSSLHLGIGQPDLGFPESVQKALVDFSKIGSSPYVPNAGTQECRASIAAKMECQFVEILVSSGVQEALAVVIFATVEEGDELLVPDPGFPAYPNLVRATGATPIPYKLDKEWQLDLDEIVSKFSENTRAIIVNSPGNPTGVTLRSEDLKTLEELCFERQIRVIADEIYSRFIYKKQAFFSFKNYIDRGHLVVDGLSKTYAMMGFRLGWICADAAFIQSVTPLHQHLVTSASSISQSAAIAALASQDSNIIETMAKRYAFTRDLVSAFYRNHNIHQRVVADSAFYFMLALGNEDEDRIDDLKFAKALLLEADVVTIPGSGFGPNGDGYLRIAYTAPEDILEEAFSRLDRFYTSFVRNEHEK